MPKTFAFVTNQFSCDRIIYAARQAADRTQTDLVVVGILDSEYELKPEVVDYLFTLSKDNNATMRLFCAEDKIAVMEDAISQHDCKYVVTGMPNSSDSVLYRLWKRFPHKLFSAVDADGELIEVAQDISEFTA